MIFNDHSVYCKYMLSAPVKGLWNSVNVWYSYDKNIIFGSLLARHITMTLKLNCSMSGSLSGRSAVHLWAFSLTRCWHCDCDVAAFLLKFLHDRLVSQYSVLLLIVVNIILLHGENTMSSLPQSLQRHSLLRLQHIQAQLLRDKRDNYPQIGALPQSVLHRIRK